MEGAVQVIWEREDRTVSELKALAQRMDVAMLLDEGLIYSEILDKTGASSATISRLYFTLF